MTPPTRPDAAAEISLAADRLRHDLGKAIRLSAPEVLEGNTDDLRARLHADVRATRRGPDGSCGAVELFARWRRESSRRLPADGPLAARVSEIARLIDEIGALGKTLDTLDRPGLERLDRLTREVARECRALAEQARPKGRKA